MTAVVGILNKRGVALAADSAVTRTKDYQQKITKNGNKLVRLSNAVPVTVMFTGNGDFLNNPWDIVARRYRQERGHIAHSTVEECMNDFFSYISSNNVFWNDNVCKNWIFGRMDNLLSEVYNNTFLYKKTNADGSLTNTGTFQKVVLRQLQKRLKDYLKQGKSPQFTDYTVDNLLLYAQDEINDAIENYQEDEDNESMYGETFPTSIIKTIKKDLIETLLAKLTTRSEGPGHAELIFSGFGKDEQYPSLINAIVCEGFDNRVNYHYNQKDVIRISDKRPVAYCPFAQKDISRSLIRGCHRSFSNPFLAGLNNSFTSFANPFLMNSEDIDFEFAELCNQVKTDDLGKRVVHDVNKLLDKNLNQLEKNLKDYDVLAMAELAESVIDLTGFHRIFTFEQEGVGGPVDVAVITKNEGFTWLNRKSWYHHKDVNGMYGSMGV